MTHWFSRAAAFLAFVCAASAQVAAQDGSVDVSTLGYDRGKPEAPVVIVEFADFACSACGLFARETLPAVHSEWIATGRARIKYIPFILGIFPRAMDAAEAAECAAEQDSFWPMHDMLYDMQREWSGAANPRSSFVEYARRMALDVASFEACLDADRHDAALLRNTRVAQQLRIRGTPTFFVNGARIQGAVPLAQMRAILETVETQSRAGAGRR